MTSNLTIKRTLIVAATLIAMTSASNLYADEATQVASAGQTATMKSTTLVNNEPCFNLRVYGDRFEQAMKAIKKEAGKPEWSWDDSDDDEKVAKNN